MEYALFIEESGENPAVALREVGPSDLGEGDLDVAVQWSGINYKDALALTGRSPIVRAPFPFIPGIDLAGTVTASRSDRFAEGQDVIQTGWGLGETRSGGYSQVARLDSRQVVPLPDGITARQAMVVGTAGFTAMLGVMALERYGLAPGPIAVTGASGGVGGWAIAFLTRSGHRVTASTGSGSSGFLEALGAGEIVHRRVLEAGARRPLDTARWGGAIDSVGGSTLEALISQTGTRGAVAACGLAGGSRLESTVFPFILRGVGLLGIDSNTCPNNLRTRAWERIARLVDSDLTTLMGQTQVTLSGVPGAAVTLLAGGVQGRVVVEVTP